jgi:hypothetical protein
LCVGDLRGDSVEVFRVVGVKMVHVTCLTGAHVVVRAVRVGRNYSLRLGRLTMLRVFIGQAMPNAGFRLCDDHHVECFRE